MPRTPVLERTSSIRLFGVGFLALVVLLVYVTYAFFTKQFVAFEPVTVRTSNVGVNLPQNADVKLRGVIVGEVRSVEPDGDGVKMNLAMKPELLADVPAGVTAQIVPKTLFGEKYVSLIPPATRSGESLQSGAVIDRASVPIEVETLLNDLYPLLQAVDPANLSYTLTAVSDALDGRGKQLGDTLVTANRYLKQVNPDVPQLITDLEKLGTVSDGYAAALPELGRTLRNVVVTGNTLVAKRAQLAAFFDEGTALSNTLTSFTQDNGDNLTQLAADARPVLQVLGDYSPTFPCFLGAMREIIPRLDSAFRDGQLHINARVIPQATPYDSEPGVENLEITQEAFDEASTGTPAGSSAEVNGDNAGLPTCLDLNEIVGNPDQQFSTQENGNVFTVPPEVYELVNVQSSHNKFGDVQPSNRVAPASDMLSMVQPSMGGLDTPQEREALNVLFGARAGIPAADVPDVASILMGPVLRGTAVSVE